MAYRSRKQEEAWLAKRLRRAHEALDKGPVKELSDKPLEVTRELRGLGWAEIGRQYDEWHNGKLWHCQEIVITEAGRAALATPSPPAAPRTAPRQG